MSVVAAVGVQVPRLSHVPAGADYGLADMAIPWLAEVVGFELDEWQRMVLREALGEREPGLWAASEIGLVVPRQNGKGAVLEARELVGLFLLRERLLIHSAHQFKTAQEHFLRLRERIEEVPELKARVRRVFTAAGEQSIVLKTGERLRILARKGGSGRGFTSSFVVFDEAMDLPESTVADMVPTQSAQPNRQRWYTGSAVDQYVQTNGVVFARVRERGIRGEDPRLAFFEWSLEVDEPDLVSDETMRDDEAIAAANPGYGIRIFRDAVEDEVSSLASRTVAVERFGVGDWPVVDASARGELDLEQWDALLDESSELFDPVCLAYAISKDRAFASIAAAGRNQDGLLHVEIVDNRRGTRWLPERWNELLEAHDAVRAVCDPMEELDGLDRIETVTVGELGQATARMFDAVREREIRHLDDPDLRDAVAGAVTRTIGDAGRAWSRKNSTVNISPLVAATLALWAASGETLPTGDFHIF